MKKLILAVSLMLSVSGANAFNSNVGYPTDAARMSLSGSVEAVIDCSSKEISYSSFSNPIFKKHINKSIHKMCYNDSGEHAVKFVFNRGGIDTNPIARQPNRFYTK